MYVYDTPLEDKTKLATRGELSPRNKNKVRTDQSILGSLAKHLPRHPTNYKGNSFYRPYRAKKTGFLTFYK